MRALADGRLRGAGLDVLPDAEDFKALVANQVLLRFPNVIVTPHNAYNTDAALQRIISTTLANIEAFARGAPQNVVSPHYIKFVLEAILSLKLAGCSRWPRPAAQPGLV